MGSRVFWTVVFGFLSGVFARSFLAIGWGFIGLLALLGVAALFSERSRRGILVAMTLFACAAGVARMQMAVVTGDANLTANLERNVTIEGIVSQEPDARDTATLVYIDADQLIVNGETVPVHAGVLAEMSAHARVAYGDHIQISGKLQLPQPFDTGSGRTFDYPE